MTPPPMKPNRRGREEAATPTNSDTTRVAALAWESAPCPTASSHACWVAGPWLLRVHRALTAAGAITPLPRWDPRFRNWSMFEDEEEEEALGARECSEGQAGS
jgi:hypothetical protein